jgi:hypothetical protein
MASLIVWSKFDSSKRITDAVVVSIDSKIFLYFIGILQVIWVTIIFQLDYIDNTILVKSRARNGS